MVPSNVPERVPNSQLNTPEFCSISFRILLSTISFTKFDLPSWLSLLESLHPNLASSSFPHNHRGSHPYGQTIISSTGQWDVLPQKQLKEWDIVQVINHLGKNISKQYESVQVSLWEKHGTPGHPEDFGGSFLEGPSLTWILMWQTWEYRKQEC